MNKEERLEYFREIAAKGGKTTVERYGIEHMRKISQKAARIRKLKAKRIRRIARRD